MVREYELMYIINPGLGGDEEYTAFADRINSLITSYGGTLVNGEPSPLSGRRKLAYPIRANGQDISEGYYVLTRFEADPAQIRLIDRDLKLAEPIIRYLLIKPEANKQVKEDE
jgi:small subunit ribosomal protein S6